MIFYPLYQWVLFFFIYCFFGWIWETSYVSIREKRFVNRGFFFGPWIPIYGFGAIAMIFATLPFKGNWILTYLVGMSAATVLELGTGLAMEKIFKVKYWDYSSQKIQFKGYICLTSSLFWGLLSVVLEKWVHSFVEKCLLSLSFQAQIVLLSILSVGFIVDGVFSFKAAFDIRRIIIAMEKLRDDIEKMKDEISAQVSETISDIDKAKEALAERIDSVQDSIQEEFFERVERIAATKGAIEEQVEDRIRQLREKREEQLASIHNLTERLHRRHPSARYKIDSKKNRKRFK